jgi:hypothetical protein
MIKKWIDKLMFKLGYFPRRRIEGKMLIVNEEKYELVIVHDNKVISQRDIMASSIPWEIHRQNMESEMIKEIGTHIWNMGELEYEAPNKDFFHRLNFRICIAIRKK